LSKLSIAIFAAALWLTAPFAVQAAGLGRLTVLSTLGQALNAEVEIVSLQPGEADQLAARLAPQDAFRQAGIEASPALASMRFTIEQRSGRPPVLRITTPQPVNEPFVDLLVELQWSNGRLVREYTVLLDPPEYKGPQAIAAAPPKPQAPAAQPLPPIEAKPEPKPAAPVNEDPPTTVTAPEAAADEAATNNEYEVKPGDTLGQIARQYLPPGVTLNQMLIGIYRANQDAFIRENINLVRSGRILNIPATDTFDTINADEANRLVQAHRNEWEEYRSRLAATPARADALPGQRAVTGKIEAKPETPPPAASQDQVRLSKVDPAKPAAPESRAARADDVAARERALKEAQSRVADLEKNVVDLQKLLELKNQQLAELEKKATAKPAPAVPAPAPAAKAPEKTAAIPEPAQPAPPPVVAEAPKAEPAPEAKKAEPAKPKPRAVPPPPPPPPSLVDEFLENPVALGGLGAILLLLVGYGLWAWRRKKATQTKFEDSVLGAAAGSPAFAAAGEAGAAAVGGSQASVSQPVSGMEAEEVDPIAEADVYMAYGRDAQAEEILKEALQKDANRIPVHAKLLEIYAKRRDTTAFEQTALKLKNLTHSTGPEWDKAAALGRSIDANNPLYGAGAGAAPAFAAAAAAAAAPALDFDLGGGTTPGGMPDITLDERPQVGAATSIDFDLGAATSPGEKEKSDFTPEGTLIMEDKQLESTVSGLDFDLGGGAQTKEEPAKPQAAAAETSGGLDFDLNLDLGGAEKMAEPAAPMDLSSISLDLGSAGEPTAAPPSNDPKWQEVATKLDLAKAYEEMGDRDGARELLSEVMKDGDDAQKGQAQQLLTKLG
jgi:pilus assembly protein FimV